MDMTTVYNAAKTQLKIDVSSLSHGSIKEEQEMEMLLNTFYDQKSRGVVETDYLTPEDYQEILKYIQDVAEIGIDEATLRANPEEQWLTQGKIDPNIKPLKLNTIKKGENKGKTTIAKHKLDNVITRIEQMLANGNVSNSFKQRAQQVLQEVEEITKQTAGVKNKNIIKYNTGTSYIMNQNLIMRLNHLYSQIKTSALTQKIGDIGEYFAGAVLAAANIKAAKEANKITVDLLKSLNQTSINKLGDDTSYHYQATYKTDEGGIQATTHATQDKVDMEVIFKEGKKINLSVKNYKNISSITIFKGNLLSLLASSQEYNNLLRIYSTSVSQDENTKNFVSQSYQLLKKICFVKALSGGQLAQNLKGDIIRTGTADYLVVNHQGKRWYVWSMQKIIKAFDNDKNHSIAKFTPDFPKPEIQKPLVKNDQYVNSLFQSHISLLAKSLTL